MRQFRLMLPWALFAALAPAQAQPPGEVRGSIVDARGGEALSNVVIQLVGGSYRATSDDVGHFRIPAVAPGDYVLNVSTVGYHVSPTEQRRSVLGHRITLPDRSTQFAADPSHAPTTQDSAPNRPCKPPRTPCQTRRGDSPSQCGLDERHAKFLPVHPSGGHRLEIFAKLIVFRARRDILLKCRGLSGHVRGADAGGAGP